MQAHWAAFGPPVYVTVAAYFKLGKGYKGRRRSGPGAPPAPDQDRTVRVSQMTASDAQELFNLFKAAGGAVN